jgi:pyruvate dehydrogenase E1 component alpha subunit
MTTMERNPAKVQGFRDDRETLLNLLRQMMLIRRFEEKAAESYQKQKIRGFLHLYIGQEATAVGAFSVLQEQDYIASHYREHGHAIARGLDTNALMAELFGKADGVSGGRGGSMHLIDASKGFMGGYAIVGAQMTLACGLGLANKHLKRDSVVVTIFGDGACNGGEFFESLNLAALWKLPVLFLLENNGFGMGTSIARAAAGGPLHDRAGVFGIPHEQVDGMDVLEVRERVGQAVAKIRAGEGPQFIEAVTYRFRGHSMADPELYRKKDEVNPWREQDPILRFAKKLSDAGVLSDEQLQAFQTDVDEEVNQAVEFAENSPKPDLETLRHHIYCEVL